MRSIFGKQPLLVPVKWTPDTDTQEPGQDTQTRGLDTSLPLPLSIVVPPTILYPCSRWLFTSNATWNEEDREIISQNIFVLLQKDNNNLHWKNSKNYRSDVIHKITHSNPTPFQSYTLPILHSSNPTPFKSYTLPILHPLNLTLFQSYTLPILHPSNLTPFQSYTLPILHSSYATLFLSHTLLILHSLSPIPFQCYTLPMLEVVRVYKAPGDDASTL